MPFHMQRLSLSFFLSSLAVASLLWVGCRHTDKDDNINPGERYVFPGENPGAPVGATNGTPSLQNTNSSPNQSIVAPHPALLLRVGERIRVIFSDLPNPPPPHEQRIREDGSITLPYNVTVMAAGKTPRQLEKDIHDKYVPRLYVIMTASVQAEERFYTVGGEVKAGGRMIYAGPTTVLRAIQAAGDFSIYARRSKIELIRSDGQKFWINWKKAKNNPNLDLEVMPGDQIIVHRRFW